MTQKLNDLLVGNSSVVFAHTTYNGLFTKFRFIYGTKNDPDTYQIQIRVMQKGEKWATFKWVPYYVSVDFLIRSIESEYVHLKLTKDIEIFARRQPRKATKKQRYYIKVYDPQPGQSTTVETDSPLFVIKE